MPTATHAVKVVYFPEVKIRITDRDGATDIVTKTATALDRRKIPGTVIDGYLDDATAHDYAHMLRTTLSWVETEDPDDRQ